MENAVGATNYRASPVSVLLPFHLISFFAFAIASPPLHVHVLLPCSDKLSALFMSAKVDVFIYLFAGAGFEVMAKFVTDSATLERARCFFFYFARVICEKVIKKEVIWKFNDFVFDGLFLRAKWLFRFRSFPSDCTSLVSLLSWLENSGRLRKLNKWIL